MNNFSDKLEGFREGHYLSQRETARLLGVSHPTISRWENGKGEPSSLHKSILNRFIQRSEQESKSYIQFLLSVQELEGHDAMMEELYGGAPA
jgi:transcriptional regulator with XRE-family HTH domain